MKVLSIDVGIKNLAFCLFETPNDTQHFKITKWDIINISEKEDIVNCCFIDKNVLCNKPAKFKKDDKCYCLKHSKKQQLQIPGCIHTACKLHTREFVFSPVDCPRPADPIARETNGLILGEALDRHAEYCFAFELEEDYLLLPQP